MADQQESQATGGGSDTDGLVPMIWESTAAVNGSQPAPSPALLRTDSAASQSAAQPPATVIGADGQNRASNYDEVELLSASRPRRTGTGRRGRGTSQPYWCHVCQRGIQAMLTPTLTCPQCLGQFVEEVDEAHVVETFVNGSDDETDGEYERLYHDLQNADPSRSRPTIPGTSLPFVTFFTLGPLGATVTRMQTPSEGAAGGANQPRPAETSQNTGNQDSPHPAAAAGNTTGIDANLISQLANGALPPWIPTNGPTSSEGPASGGAGQNTRQAGLDNFAAGLVPGILADFLGSVLGAQSPERPNQQQSPGQVLLQQIFHFASNPGDYVFGQNALDNVISAMMEQQQGRNAPPPAPESVLDSLPRSFVTETEVLEGADCAVCRDEFVRSDNAVRLPCAHLFHEDCIMPWLKLNGTCPTCRHSLTPTPENAEAQPSVGLADAREPPPSVPYLSRESEMLPSPDPLD